MLGFLKPKSPRKAFDKLFDSYALPDFPQAIMKTLEKIRDPQGTAASVAAELSVDPGMSVKVLKAVNSAAFSRRERVQNLSQAVALLGLSYLESLLLSIGVGNIFPKSNIPEMDPKQFWEFSALRGLVARDLGEIIHRGKPMECFTAGLLQDMAVPFIAQNKPKEYEEILKKFHTSDRPLEDLEQEAFGWTHAQVAAWISEKWELPENLTQSIEIHHDKENSDNEKCPASVHLVSYLKDSESHSGKERLLSVAAERFNLTEEQVSAVFETNLESARELVASMT